MCLIIFPLSKNQKLGFCKNVSLDFYLQSRIKKLRFSLKNYQSTAPADKFLEALEIKHVYGQLYSPVETNRDGTYIDFKNGIGRKAKPKCK